MNALEGLSDLAQRGLHHAKPVQNTHVADLSTEHSNNDETWELHDDPLH
jgi:hypothetical protein